MLGRMASVGFALGAHLVYSVHHSILEVLGLGFRA